MTNHQTALVLFAIAVAVAILAAALTIAENVNARMASNETPLRIIEQPPLHPLLDRPPEQEPERVAPDLR
ncbi:hypothetical protein ACE10Z_14165 [Bradyrhizobium sp. Pha-3]|uniref:hypothetical protein n=1 Tax=Bradyrhizobium sp. Pha-3 TaxID=208375 RepID=UPI0035D3E88D